MAVPLQPSWEKGEGGSGQVPRHQHQGRPQAPGRICGDAGSWKSPSAHKRAVKVALFEAMSVHEFGEWYFKEIVCRDVKNPSGIRRYLDKEIYPRLAERTLKDLPPTEIQGLVYRKRDGGHPAAAVQIRNLLKRMFDYAVANGLLITNPVLTIPMRFRYEQGLHPMQLKRL